jgi:hypothetical protein
MIAGIGSGIFDGYQHTQKLAPIFNVVTEPNRKEILSNVVYRREAHPC